MNLDVLTTRQAARALGVSEASLKRWCDQGLLPAVRTPGGHRRLPTNGVIQFVRAQKMDVVRPSILGLPTTHALLQQASSDLHERLQQAFDIGREQEIRSIIFGLYLAGESAVDILDRYITPVFHQIGNQFASGTTAIYEERRAVELALRELHRLCATLPAPDANAPRAIGGTLAGDLYMLPTMMVETVLREAGWRAQSYGCGHPVHTLVQACTDVQPDLLWLSVSHVESTAQFLNDYGGLAQHARELGIQVLVGGRALTSEMRARMSYFGYAEDMRELVRLAAKIYAPARSPDQPIQ